MAKQNKVTFIDFFAGAGGFSEGFLQAETPKSHFDFLLGSDINENCEVTHIMRYKHQLGLKDNKFLCKDITDEDFLHQLKTMLDGKQIDVICGGPPCQSFSLAGRRRTFDKKDDLFKNYLNIVRELKPKFFVMENVKGILTKYNGEVIERIKREVSEILDEKEVKKLQGYISKFIKSTNSVNPVDKKNLENISNLIGIISKDTDSRTDDIQKYFQSLYNEFTSNVSKFSNYHKSKTDIEISTIRHGLKMLVNASSWNKISLNVMKAKGASDIDNDHFVDQIDSFLSSIDPDSVINQIETSLAQIKHKGFLDNLIHLVNLYKFSIEEYTDQIEQIIDQYPENRNSLAIKKILLSGLNLYQLKDPMVLLASDYGVPQNRERVIFLGCRKDQPLIESITKTTPDKKNKVSVFEALNDIDNIGINEHVDFYKNVSPAAEKFNTKHRSLLHKRLLGGAISNKVGKTFSQWSKEGRLNPKRFKIKSAPFCTNYNEYTDQNELEHLELKESPLNNHQTSNHSPQVQKRLGVIRKYGDYKKAAQELEEKGLSSKKRNYAPFNFKGQSTTIMTIADDYIHYRANRAPTVREMARLQSFDDSFVFQGKRTTGGDRRKSEVPQFTLVGNAVPPLMARAIADEILKHIQ